MAALLVSLAVMSVLMGALLPAWRHQAQREKEAELVFRGEQYVRAIRLWEMKMGPGSRPPNFDILVQQKFLRKKYKDPMTEDGEFQPLYVGANLPAPGGAGPGGRGPSGPGAGGRGRAGRPRPGNNAAAASTASGIGGQMGGGGILGVASKSKETSIRIYKGRSHYNEWTFVFANASSAPGGVGGQMPGGRGGSPVSRAAGAFPVAAVPAAAECSQAESAASVRAAAASAAQGPVVNPGIVPPGGRGR